MKKKQGDVLYEIETTDKTVTRHANQIKPRYSAAQNTRMSQNSSFTLQLALDLPLFKTSEQKRRAPRLKARKRKDKTIENVQDLNKSKESRHENSEKILKCWRET